MCSAQFPARAKWMLLSEPSTNEPYTHTQHIHFSSAFHQGPFLMAERRMHYKKIPATASCVGAALTVTLVPRPKFHFQGHLSTHTVAFSFPQISPQRAFSSFYLNTENSFRIKITILYTPRVYDSHPINT